MDVESADIDIDEMEEVPRRKTRTAGGQRKVVRALAFAEPVTRRETRSNLCVIKVCTIETVLLYFEGTTRSRETSVTDASTGVMIRRRLIIYIIVLNIFDRYKSSCASAADPSQPNTNWVH